ncbi:SDR family oxidoreductase [Ktedonospora formicarum]|uniref:Short chain dehydrogenase n=1 Tax=Ktedonospora formicarum TaxID=2778364 RepID=A0A8J3MSB4_9CHLR|nr:SDR family oxidoreductase [Ktedonospora formicarum]GHO45925.1 short chain dehydrogenase [Ktedonospora formicarum]
MSTQGKNVFIVGGSSGIGLASAHLTLAQGANVTVASSSVQRLEQAKASLGGKVKTAKINMLNPSEVKEFFTGYSEMIDHLVISNPTPKEGAFLELEIEEARQLFEEKFWGLYHIAKYAEPHMTERGSLTFFSGVNVVSAKRAPLAAVNAAVNALVTSLAIELAPRRVNAISPGIIDTPLRAYWPLEARQAVYAFTERAAPVGKVGTAEEVAQGILYLLNNPYVSGTVLDIDGGLRLI